MDAAADAETIQKAYRQRRRMMHPDRYAGLPESDQRAAHDEYVQLDEARRLLLLNADKGPSHGPHRGGQPEDGPRTTRPGAGLHRELRVSENFAHFGGVRSVMDGAGHPVSVRVPAGLSDGTRLRIRGRGEAGSPPGDLYVTVRIIPEETSAWAAGAESRPQPHPMPSPTTGTAATRKPSGRYYVGWTVGILLLVAIILTIAGVNGGFNGPAGQTSPEVTRYTAIEFSVSPADDAALERGCSVSAIDCRGVYLTTRSDCARALVTVWWSSSASGPAEQETQVRTTELIRGVPKLVVTGHPQTMPAYATFVDVECEV